MAAGIRCCRVLAILVVVADPGEERAVAAALRLLPVLLPAEPGQVEIGVGADELVRTAGIGRVGVEDLPAVLAGRR